MSENASELLLRDVEASDLSLFFEFGCEPEAIYMAAFTAKEPDDRAAFEAHWGRILSNEANLIKTIVVDGQVVGSVSSFEQFGEREVTYWLGKRYWGQGIATRALAAFLEEERTRPLFGRAAKDNIASIGVLQKCGFVITGEDKGFANGRGRETEEFILMLNSL